ARAEARVAVDRLLPLAIGARHVGEEGKALEEERLAEVEIEEQRAARHLRHDREARAREVARLREDRPVSVLAVDSGEERRPRHRAAARARDLGELVEEEARAGRRLHDAALRSREAAREL